METQKIICPCCKMEFENQPDICVRCKYPFVGTEQEKSHFIAHYVMGKGYIRDSKDAVKRSRVILWIIAAIQILYGIYMYMYGAPNDLNKLEALFSVITGVVFVVLGFATYYKPFVSVLIATCILTLFYILPAFSDPSLLIRGIVWKAIVFTSLFYSLDLLIKAKKAKENGVKI